MKPMVMRTLPFICPCCNLSWELTLKSWNNTVKWKGVSSQMDPSGMCSKNSKSLSWPQSIMLMPRSNIRLSKLHIFPKTINIEFPYSSITFIFKTLSKDFSPFGTGNFFFEISLSLTVIHAG